VRRRFVTNLALVLVLNLLVKPFYILGIDAEVQVRMGADAYGSYAALMSLSFLLNILLDLGITNWNTRHVARITDGSSGGVSGLLPLRGLLVLFYFIVLLPAAMLIGFSGAQLGLLALLGLNQALAATLLYLRSHIAGAQRFTHDSVLSVLDRVLLIVICSVLLWAPHFHDQPFQLRWFVLAQTTAYALAVCVALFFARRDGLVTGFRWEPKEWRAVLRDSAPYALLVLLMTFYYRTDTLMLERLLPDGPAQAGVYAQGFRFFEALNMMGFLLAGLLLPMFSRMLKEGDPVGPLAGLALRLVIAGGVAVAVTGSVHAKQLMDLRYAEHTSDSAVVFAILVWSFVAVCTTYVYGTLLTASGELWLLNWMAAGGMVLNITLNFVLIPRYQVVGAAFAGLVTQGLTALVQVALASRKFGLHLPGKAIAAGGLYTSGLFALAWLGRGWPLVQALILIGAGAVILVLLTRLVDVRAVWKVFVPKRTS
jgi:O-antigen/teichoic acid export membrane protein